MDQSGLGEWGASANPLRSALLCEFALLTNTCSPMASVASAGGQAPQQQKRGMSLSQSDADSGGAPKHRGSSSAYRLHLLDMMATVRGRPDFAALLTPAQLAMLSRFEAMDACAQGLMARLVQRKGE